MKIPLGITSTRKLGSITLVASVVALLAPAVGLQNLRADTLVVTSTADDGSPGTLRAVLAAAGHGDVIDATTVTGTITLLPQLLASSQLEVTTSVIIRGPGPANLTINGNQTGRIFRIFPELTVSIDGFTITNGLATGAPQFSFPPDAGA